MGKTKSANGKSAGKFQLNYLNSAQKTAKAIYDQHDVVFLSGPAGVGKSYMAMAFAIYDVLKKDKRKIVLTRPIIEAGESLGFLPGSFYEKVNPYMMPLYNSLEKLVGKTGPQREFIDRLTDIAPIAYMRGVTFDNAVCIFDEAQNATMPQLKLFLSRLGENSKMVVTGDPTQTDLKNGSAFAEVMQRLETLPGIGIVRFKRENIVRHSLVSSILERLEE